MRCLGLILFILGGFPLVADASSEFESGALVYSDEVNGEFKSLVYRDRDGEISHVFDEGLSFNYNSQHDSANLSPDKAYSVVQFSEEGESESGTSKIYLCAFVRMSDGCVVHVAAGEQCGGEWSSSGEWGGPDPITYDELKKNAPIIDKVYAEYSSKWKGSTQVSTPKVLAYLLEGTTFDNLLVCNPPGESNAKIYDAMLRILEQDGDVDNYAKLKSKMVGVESSILRR